MLEILKSLKSLKLRSLETLASDKLVKSGTTVLAFKCKDGIIAAGDRRASFPGYESSGEYCKIEDLSDYSVMGAAGMVACIQELGEIIRNGMGALERTIGDKIYIDGEASFLKEILRENFKEFGLMSEILGYGASPFLAGYNPASKSFHIFKFDGAGGIYESDNYVSLGSGSHLATAILDDQWAKDMKLKDGAFLAIRAISRAARDLYTSPPALYPVTIKMITADGVDELPAKDSLLIAWAIYIRDMQRRGDKERISYFAENISESDYPEKKKKKSPGKKAVTPKEKKRG